MSTPSHTTGERGSILVFSLLVLLVVTITAFSLMGSTSTELSVAGNERFQTLAFYTTESGWQEEVAWLDNQYSPFTENQTIAGDLNVGLNSTHDVNSSYEVRSAFIAYSATDLVGYSLGKFLRYYYEVDSMGEVPARHAISSVTVRANKIYQAGEY